MPPAFTLPYPEIPSENSRVLVIGHDPRLRDSDTLANHAFFADFFFKPVPTRSNDLAKYGLASAIFAYVGELTNYQYTSNQFVFTNLCNMQLPHAPKGKVVLIPEQFAIQGLAEIRRLILQARIELIFAMSEQVNYWLQALGFYTAQEDFLLQSAPKLVGVNSKPPFYEPKKPKAFQLIAYRRFETGSSIPLYPIVHVRSWPLRNAFKKAYGQAYFHCINDLKPNNP